MLYECGICGCYHPWSWNSACRDDENRYDSPEEYAERWGLDVCSLDIRSKVGFGAVRIFGLKCRGGIKYGRQQPRRPDGEPVRGAASRGGSLG